MAAVLGFGATTSGQQPPVPASPAPSYHRLLVLPFVGVQSYQTGYNQDAYDLGFRAGAIVGWRYRDFLSLNAQVATESFSPPGYDERTWEWAFSPLAEFDDGKVVLALGPMLGYWRRTSERRTFSLLLPASERDSGWVWGINAGFFVRTVVGVSVGGIFGLQDRSDTTYCHTSDGEHEICDPLHRSADYWMLSAAVAVLY
jgi:hypothetical protein